MIRNPILKVLSTFSRHNVKALLMGGQTIRLEGDTEQVLMLSLPDLVQAKKTQRDKDWPMIRRLLEADYLNAVNPSRETILFWFRENRTPEILGRLCATYAHEAASIAAQRPAVAAALSGDLDKVGTCLVQEEAEERRRDAAYWKPLRQELELLRHGIAT